MTRTITVIVAILIAGTTILFSFDTKRPPNFETAFTAFADYYDDYLEARGNNSGDTASLKTAVISAYNYLHANWTNQQINDNVNALWPTPFQVQVACIMNCKKQLNNCWYNCGGPFPNDCIYCDPAYEECKANCHW